MQEPVLIGGLFVKILLSVIAFLCTSAIALLIYIWNERKKQIEKAAIIQEHFNGNIKDELKIMETLIKENEKSQNSLNNTIIRVECWMKTIASEHRDNREMLLRHENDLTILKSKK